MDNSTLNVSSEGQNQLSTMIVYTVFGIFGVLGNGLVLLVIALADDLRGVTNLFIANQSLIDLSSSIVLIASFVLPLPPLPLGRPALARFLCRFWYTKYPFWSLIVASSLNLTLMTLERLYAIFFPIRYRSQTNFRCLKMMAAIPWSVGFLFQIVSVLAAQVQEKKCVILTYSDPAFTTIFGAVAISLEFVFPVLVMIVVYTSIAIRLRIDGLSTRRQVKADGSSKNPPAIDYRRRATRNTIKTMFIVSIFFILCWFLNQLVVFILNCCGAGVELDSLLYRISVFMGFGNMWINPFIYSFQYRWFQKGLKKVFCKSIGNRNSKDLPTLSRACRGTSNAVENKETKHL